MKKKTWMLQIVGVLAVVISSLTAHAGEKGGYDLNDEELARRSVNVTTLKKAISSATSDDGSCRVLWLARAFGGVMFESPAAPAITEKSILLTPAESKCWQAAMAQVKKFQEAVQKQFTETTAESK